MGYIYLRTNKINGKKYVGQVIRKHFKQRQNSWKCMTQPYAGVVINRARAKYGIDAFDFEILKECEDKELNYWEMYYIKELNTKTPYGYNMTDGGEGRCGHSFPHTAETKKKISEALKGKERSEEHKKHISESKKGIKHTAEQNNKHSERMKGEKNPFYGKKHSEESKQKMSKARKGKKRPIDAIIRTSEKLSKSVMQIDIVTNETIAVYKSMTEAVKSTGCYKSNIIECCKKRRNTAGGFKWKYAV